MAQAAENDHPEVRAMLDEVVALRGADPAAASAVALSARVLARAIPSTIDEAEAVHHLASLAHERGDTETAFALASETLDLVVGLDAHPVHAWALHLIGVIHYGAGNHAFSLDAARRALDVYRESGDEGHEGRFLSTIAAVHQSMGDHDTAIRIYDEALAVNEASNRLDLATVVLGNLARLRGRRGEHFPAVKLGRDAIDMAREHAPLLVAGLHADLGEALAAVGDHAGAAASFADARADWNERISQGGEVSVAEQLAIMISEGRVALRSGNHGNAIASLTSAIDLAEAHDFREARLELHDHLATAFKQEGRPAEALRHRELQFALHREVAADAADLRLRTIQAAHADEAARRRSEMTRLRKSELSANFLDAHSDVDAFHLEAFERLAVVAELRGGNTAHHTDVVGDLAAEIAHAAGRTPEWCEQLRLAARLHDIGKVAVADSVLLKPGPLDVGEYDAVKQHTIVGRRMLSGVSTPLFEMAAECAWSHHEWWDGTGYPNGLAGSDIPLAGRIVAIADVFDALSTRRRYKREWGIVEAMRHVQSGARTQFDPDLVDAFAAVLRARHPDIASQF